MAFHLHADDGPTLNTGLVAMWFDFQGIRTSIARKPYIFVIFQGVFRTPCPPFWIHAWKILLPKHSKTLNSANSGKDLVRFCLCLSKNVCKLPIQLSISSRLSLVSSSSAIHSTNSLNALKTMYKKSGQVWKQCTVKPVLYTQQTC